MVSSQPQSAFSVPFVMFAMRGVSWELLLAFDLIFVPLGM